MKIAAVLAEFNPYHHGHNYFLNETRRMTGADFVIVLLGGEFTQRGEPAFWNCRTRAKAALLSGADLILRYPVRYATASAEAYAEYAIRILNELPPVDLMVFGSESGELSELRECADILYREDQEYRTALKDGLAKGLSYPHARSAALPQFADLLNHPNNILAVEYLRALQKTRSRIEPVTIKRTGDHRSDDPGAAFPSASAIRKALADPSNIRETILSEMLPETVFDVFQRDASVLPPDLDDFSDLLYEKLLSRDRESLVSYCDMNDGLAGTILRALPSYRSYTQFRSEITKKNDTQAHVSRALLHILLDLKKEETSEDPGSYAHVIGIRRDAEDLLKEICKTSRIPILTRIRESLELTGPAARRFQEDLLSATLYEYISSKKNDRDLIDPKTEPLIRV